MNCYNCGKPNKLTDHDFIMALANMAGIKNRHKIDICQCPKEVILTCQQCEYKLKCYQDTQKTDYCPLPR